MELGIVTHKEIQVIPFLAVTVMLVLVGFHGEKTPPCKPIHVEFGECTPDTVWYHLKVTQQMVGAVPVEDVDTTFVIKSWEK